MVELFDGELILDDELDIASWFDSEMRSGDAPVVAEILASGVISLAGALSMQTIAQMQGSGTIQFTGSASGVQRLPNVGTVQVRNQVAGVRIWTESL